MYAREVQGQVLTFGVSGKLIMNALVMYDRETDSLWSQFLGVAVDGPMKGTRLEPLGSTLTTWARWRELHPDTLALNQGSKRGDSYGGYYTNDSAGVLGEYNIDERLRTKEFVLGLQLDGRARAYPFRHLSAEPVVNDRLGGTALVVAFDRDTGAGSIYDRRAGGRTLTFEYVEEAEGGEPVLMRDRETGTLWAGMTGEALEGPLAGERLRTLPSMAVFWFAWSDYFPGADLYDPVPAAG